MITRKIIRYEILVEYYKAYGCLPLELIDRKTDFHYNKGVYCRTCFKNSESN